MMNSQKRNKKEVEDLRKKEDEAAAAKAFEEYVATFQDSSGPGGLGGGSKAKVWIKAGTYDAGRRQEDTKEKGKLYKPTSRFINEEQDQKPSFILNESKHDRSSLAKKNKEKKKSNLEIFKEELKIIQEEREERHRLKKMLGLQEVIKLPPKPGDDLRASLSLELEDMKSSGSIDDGDPNTTNIYLGNLPTKITEHDLLQLFGKFGPLASVKIMWPRTDEEKSRNRLSGFVAFMARRDGERALKHLAGKDLFNADVKLGWGKAVPIPAFPIYIPPAMMELTMPPPPSGLPFNAQVDKRERAKFSPGSPYPTEGKSKEEFERMLQYAAVKVVIPTDRTLLALIHRMIEFVAREGPMFEAMIMNREISNQQYRFLFENQSPAHIYYRWKLYSIIQGESTQRWRTEEFRMFKNGSIWKPPTLNPFTQGMPDELIPEEEREIKKGSLSNAQRVRLERMLRKLTPERHKIAEVMIFSIEHAEAVTEIAQCLKESLGNPKTSLQKKIARLYTISDILYNCTAKNMNAVHYRKGFKVHLPAIFQELHYAYQTACSESSSSADCFKERVMGCCRAWDDWGIYPNEFLIRLQNIFLGLLSANSREEEEKILEGLDPDDENEELLKKRFKLAPKAQLPPKSALNLVKSLQSNNDDDVDEEDIDGIPMTSGEREQQSGKKQEVKKSGSFVPSKWETVDPEEVKAGAVTTTSKWDLFEQEQQQLQQAKEEQQRGLVAYDEEEDEDIDGVPMVEEEDMEKRRTFLREVEMKVLAYQDELETGRGGHHVGGSVREAVEEYRKRLLNKKGSSNGDKKRGYSDEDEEEEGEMDSDDEERGSRRRRRRRSSSSTRSSSKRHHERDRDRDESRSQDSSSSSPHRSRRRHRDSSSSSTRRRRSHDSDPEDRDRDRSRSRERRRHHYHHERRRHGRD